VSDDKNSEVDPRFDPAFQRGFDPSIPIEEYVPPPVPRRATAPLAAPAPVALVPDAAVPVPASATTPAVVASGTSIDDDASADEHDSGAELDASPSRNPFLLFLGIIAVGLVVAGIWLFVQSGDAFNGKQVRSQGDYMSLDATIHAAPFIALLGGATAIAILFVFAARWRRR
jgi:hypothetical protein